MKCTNCEAEIGGKRYCPNCGAETKYDGAVQGAFPSNRRLYKTLRKIFNLRTLFFLLCLLIIIAAQFTAVN